VDGHNEYRELHTILNETVASFAHLYAYGISKCTFLALLTGRPIDNLEDDNCPRQTLSIIVVACPATDFPNTLAQQKPRVPSTIDLQNKISSNALPMTRHAADFVSVL